MTAKEAIDRYFTQVLQLPAVDGDTDLRRSNALQWLQEGGERIYYAKAWPFRRTVQDPFSLTSGAAVLPTDFVAVGEKRKGGVWVKSTGVRLLPLEEHAMRDKIYRPGGPGDGDPTHYSVYGLNLSDYQMNLVTNTTGSMDLVLAYERAFPSLSDDDTDNSLSYIPLAFHESAVWPVLRAYGMKRKGDADADPEAAIRRAITIIAKATRGDVDGPDQSPSFFEGTEAWR